MNRIVWERCQDAAGLSGSIEGFVRAAKVALPIFEGLT